MKLLRIWEELTPWSRFGLCFVAAVAILLLLLALF